MRAFLTLFALLLGAVQSSAQEGPLHTVVVIDDSGYVQDHLNTSGDPNDRAKPGMQQARGLLLGKLAKLPRRDTITVVSVALPQVIWQGKANEIARRDNYTLADFLLSPYNGCANFDAVMEAVERSVDEVNLPVKEVIFLSSLIHTGGNSRDFTTCREPQINNLAFPETTLDALSRMMAESNMSVSFYWAIDLVEPQVANYFRSKGLPYKVYGERASLQALAR